MEILQLKDKYILKKVYLPIFFQTDDGEKLSIVMRDSGFEFTYQGEKYSAKNGIVKKGL